jgi:hypothetical protein
VVASFLAASRKIAKIAKTVGSVLVASAVDDTDDVFFSSVTGGGGESMLVGKNEHDTIFSSSRIKRTYICVTELSLELGF